LLSALEGDVKDLLGNAFENATTMTEQMAALDASAPAACPLR